MRLLLVAPRYPWPPRRGDQLRTVQHLAALQGHHEVLLLVPEPPAGAPEPPPGVTIEYYRTPWSGSALGLAKASAGGWPLQAGLFHHRSLSLALGRLVGQVDKVIFVLARLALHLDDVGDTPVILDFVDSLALNFRRRALFDSHWRRPPLRMEAERLAKAERRIAERVERCLVVGERDRWALVAHWPESLAEKLEVVRLRVDLPEKQVEIRESPEPPRLVVTGNLGYFPTQEGLAWWLNEVWPLLRRLLPDLQLCLAGSRPPRRLRRLARQEGIELETQPEDLVPFVRHADLALAPLRAGSGVPVKILEAWAEGAPVVASPWAAEGAEARPGVECAVCSEPGEWVDTVVALLGDPARRRGLAEAGRKRLAEKHGRSAVEGALLGALRAR